MVDKRTVTEMAGDLFIERRKQDGTLAAAMFGRPTGSTELGPARERDAFWKRALSPEEEAQLWQQGLAEAAQQGVKPDDAIKQLAPKVSAQVFPYRWEMAPWGGRDTPDQVAAWAARHAAQGPPDAANRPSTSIDVNRPESTSTTPAPSMPGKEAPHG